MQIESRGKPQAAVGESASSWSTSDSSANMYVVSVEGLH